MLKICKNTLEYFSERNAEKIKVFFYDAGCSGTKVDIVDEFEMDESVIEISPLLTSPQGRGIEQSQNSEFSPLGGDAWKAEGVIKIFVDKREKEKFKNCTITRVVTADHTGKEKVRYIYKSEEVKGRCGCGSSFSFWEKQKPKLDLTRLRDFKSNFKK